MSADAIIEELTEKYKSDTGSIFFARYADALLQAERTDEAMDICRQGIQAHPYYITGYIVLGRCCIKAGSPDEAVSQLDSALRLDGRCTNALKMLGTICLDKRDYAGAAEKFGTILDIDPFNSEVKRLREEAAAKSGGAMPAAGAPGADDGADEDISDMLEEFDDADLDEIDSETLTDDMEDSPGADEDGSGEDDVMGTLDTSNSAPPLGDEAPPAEIGADIAQEADAADLAGEDVVGALDALDTESAPEEGVPSAETESETMDEPAEADLAGDDIMGALDALDAEAALEKETPSAEMEADTVEEPAEAELAGDDIMGALDALDSEPPLENSLSEASGAIAEDDKAEADLAGDDVMNALDALDIEAAPEEKALFSEMETDVSDEKPEADFAGDDIMGALDALDSEYSAGAPGNDDGISAELDLAVPAETAGIPEEEEEDGLDGNDVTSALTALDLGQDPEEAEMAEAPEDEDDLSGDDMADALGMLDMGDQEEDKGKDDTGLSGSDVEAAFDILDVGDDSPGGSDVDETAETVILTRSDLDAMKGDEMQRPQAAPRKPVFDEYIEDEEATVALTNLDLGEDDGDPAVDDSAEESPPVKTDPLNVATVTLAEIYFKQGLKEQAIDIYRQLLEREPGNQQIAHRIDFIKASRVETTDVPIVSRERRRRPRPGGSASS